MARKKKKMKKNSIKVENDEVVSIAVDSEMENDPEFQTGELGVPAKDQLDVPRILFLVFLNVAVLMLGISAVSGYYTSRALSREISTQGYVVDYVERIDSEGEAFSYPVIEFYLPDNSLLEVELSEGTWPPSYRVGQEVTVLYNPERPTDARIKSVMSTILRWALSIFLGVFGLGFLGGALLMRWMMKTDPSVTQQPYGHF